MKYYLIAGEASGDLHGANLMRALRQKDPQAEFRFWGGDNMAAIGGTPVRHIRDLAIMGFVEVLAHLRTVLGNIAFCKRDITQWKPDVVVGIDYPGFNLKIEAWAHEQGFKTVHYISPNLWAWKKGRIKGMRRTLDRLCYILPFEEEFFAENDMPQAVYVGHPLLDMINEECGKKGLNQPIQPSTQTRPIIALLPGSRRMELKNSLPLMVHLAAHHPEYQFIVAGMSLIGKEFYDTLTAKHSCNQAIKQSNNLTVVFDQTYSLLSQAHAAIICSGTATLEAALFNVPQVVCYSGNPISYLIAKAVVGNRIRYISLVNLIADSPIVTELIQDDFNAERLEREFHLVAADDANRERMLNEYADMRTLLGSGGASMRAAQTIIDILK